MNELFEQLRHLQGKIDYLKKTLKPSLDEDEQIKNITIIIRTNKNLFDWAKNIEIAESNKPNFYNVSLQMNDDPKNSLLADIYAKHKTKDWVAAKYGHDRPTIDLLINANTIKQIINWYYSTLN